MAKVRSKALQVDKAVKEVVAFTKKHGLPQYDDADAVLEAKPKLTVEFGLSATKVNELAERYRVVEEFFTPFPWRLL